MPVEQADRDHLAWLNQEEQKATWRIRLPAGATVPGQPAPVNIPVVNAAVDDPVDSDEDGVPEADEYYLLPDWTEHPFAKPGSADVVAAGTVQFVGGYWPDPPVLRAEISAAYTEARAIIASGLAQAEAALRGDPTAMQMMGHWFGARQPVIPPGEDWWLGVRMILSKLHAYRGRDLYVYLNGAAEKDEQQDWPRAGVYENATIEKEDTQGYASSVEKADDMVVIFHRLYCDKTRLLVGTQPAYTNAASVIVHELTHCLGGSQDHATFGGHLVYDVRVAWAFGQAAPAQAWYNACNLEYFCVEAHYGDVDGAVAALIQEVLNSDL